MRYRLLLILLMLSPLWVKAQNLEDFKWQYRLLVINHDGQRGDMMHDIVAFNLDFACEIRERKILVVEYINGMHENLNAWPLDEEGIWLIGLDGVSRITLRIPVFLTGFLIELMLCPCEGLSF